VTAIQTVVAAVGTKSGGYPKYSALIQANQTSRPQIGRVQGQTLILAKVGRGAPGRASLRPSRSTGVARNPGQVEALDFRAIFSMTCVGEADRIGS
jgi:hypothetical protein